MKTLMWESWIWLILPGLLCLFFFPLLFQGYVLSQSDVLYFFPPWSAARLPHLTHPSNSLLSDLSLQFYPFAVYMRSLLTQGELPLWNPYILGGVPFLANLQSAVFYPTSLFFLLFPIEKALGISAFVRLSVAGLSTYLLARTLAFSAWGSVLAGMSFMLCAFNVLWLNHPHTNVAVLLPLLLLGVEGVLSDRRYAFFVLALATTLVFLGGHPEMAFHVSVAASLYCLVRVRQVWNQGGGEPWNRLGRVAGGYTLGLLGAGIVVVPFLEILLDSEIATYRARMPREAFFLPVQALWTFIVPDIFGHPATGEVGGPLNYNDRTGYIGIVPFLLAVAVLPAIRQDNRVRLFALLATGALLLALGVWPFFDLLSVLPFVHSVPHQRLLLVYEFAAAFLAARALDRLLQESHARPLSLLCLLFSGILFLGLSAMWFELIFPLAGSARAGVVRAVCLTGVVLGWMSLFHWRVLAGRVWAAGMCLLTGIDLFLFGFGYTPMVPEETVLTTTPPAVRYLQRQPGLFRIAGIGERGILIPNTAMLYGLMDVRGYEPMVPGRVLHFFEEALKGEIDIGGALYILPREEVEQSLLNYLSLLNVQFLMSSHELTSPQLEKVYDAEVKIYNNHGALPRAWVVQAVKIVRDGAAAFQQVVTEKLDFRHVAVVEGLDRILERGLEEQGAGTARARVVVYTPHVVEVEAESSAAGFLVLSDTYFRGWRAFVDGQAAPIYRANYIIRAVPLTAGKHHVTFVYDPLSFRIGLGLSLLAYGILTGWAVVCFVNWYRTRAATR